MFAEEEVIVAANKLFDVNGIEQLEAIETVTYFHILLDDHQIVFSNGAATESLFLGTETLNAPHPKRAWKSNCSFPRLQPPKHRSTAHGPF